jgi:hypothetical protein
MATDWYAPNQQVVRADGSGPAEEGTGGSTPEAPEAARSSSEPQEKPEKSIRRGRPAQVGQTEESKR